MFTCQNILVTFGTTRLSTNAPSMSSSSMQGRRIIDYLCMGDSFLQQIRYLPVLQQINIKLCHVAYHCRRPDFPLLQHCRKLELWLLAPFYPPVTAHTSTSVYLPPPSQKPSNLAANIRSLYFLELNLQFSWWRALYLTALFPHFSYKVLGFLPRLVRFTVQFIFYDCLQKTCQFSIYLILGRDWFLYIGTILIETFLSGIRLRFSFTHQRQPLHHTVQGLDTILCGGDLSFLLFITILPLLRSSSSMQGEKTKGSLCIDDSCLNSVLFTYIPSGIR